MRSERAARRFAWASAIIFAALVPLFFHSFGRGPHPVLRRGAPATAEQSAPRSAAGVERAARLLPLARRLTAESLTELAGRYGLGAERLRSALARVEGVTEVGLEEDLGGLAEFDEEKPTRISVGEEYARDLEGDDEALLLLAHELTHAAAMDGDLDPMIERTAAEAGSRAGVFAAEGQKEDLLCEYVGAQALKRFARLSPGGWTLSERVGRAIGVEEEGADEEDQEHLSPAQTWRALRALDGELR